KSRYSAPIHGSATPYRRQDNRSTSRQYNSGLPESGEKKFQNGSASSLIHLSSTNSSSAAITNELSTDSRPPSINNDENYQSRANSLSSTTSSAIQSTPYQNDHVLPVQRFNFALMHTIMLVTCYSDGRQGLKTTLDSLVATDYPSSHKIIMCIADGLIYGAGNDLSTPETCLSLMSGFIVPKEEVRAHSYVAIADGKKRHNKAKVYAGYYKYHENDDSLKVVRRIPMITLVKCGGPGDDEKKAGNRGKRDSQLILMSFLQKVMFDERMTPLEYEFFNAIRTVSGVTPDCFELVLMVDADTKIFPDSLTRMVACMSRDPAVMGLCGETKIANKSDTWVTMIQ
ncbi:7474_t:CDS:2, partial [Dentiscutata erythropus]